MIVSLLTSSRYQRHGIFMTLVWTGRDTEKQLRFKFMNQAQKKHKKRFVLTMRNEKGQVGIFVALIFQVIFVFFAMLVNVGLVVHHKINLQQSTDLAAYYGAMKQAEIMNVMAHVNFQIRQAWKLMAWRYRVLGTFGLEHNNSAPLPSLSPIRIEFPVTWPEANGYIPRYNPNSRSVACSGAGPDADGLTITDVPFMCLGHIGFGDWISAPNDRETFCKVECNAIQRMKAFSISKILGVGTSSIYGNSMGASVNAAIGRANDIVHKTCNSLGPITTQMLALYYGNYIKDTRNRRNFIYMLTKNLGLPEDKMLDIEGKSVLTGVQNTLKNNLTEANLTSMTGNSISTLNGVKSFGGSGSFAESMMKEINFQRLLFFMIDCIVTGGGASSIELKSLYQGAAGDLDTQVLSQLSGIMDATGVAAIQNLFNQNTDASNILGYEKNPWIQVYYGVKATSEPKIPFLPLAKIKLSAVSFAKPFGGTIGPRYFKDWPSNIDDNKSRSDWENRTDFNLPRRNLSGLTTTTPTLKDAREFIFNYSTHVGDTYSNDAPNRDPANKGGLANSKIVGFYHTLLANKYGKQTSTTSDNKTQEPNQGLYSKPQVWPKYAEWYHLAADVTDPTYDPLAVDRTNPAAPKNTFMRDIELTVVSPNQFDATYYSIEPDFLKNYSSKLTAPVIQTMASNAGLPNPPTFPVDFGNRGRSNFGGIPTEFSVRHQMQVTHDFFKTANDIVSPLGSGDDAIRFGLDVLATRQSSLLTGWTFLNLSSAGFSTFPGANTGGGKFSMLFGTCDADNALNPWTENFKAPYEVGDTQMPAVPGNCVTGGRMGYSVKLISSELLRVGKMFEDLGGPGTAGQIKNPVPDQFLQF